MTEFLDKLDFYVLPVVNIDGYIYTWTTVKEPMLRGADEIKINHSVTLVLTYTALSEPHVEKDPFHQNWIYLHWHRPQQKL